MKDIFKSKKQLIKELEDARRVLSQKSTKALKADATRKDAGPYREVAENRRDKEALLLIRKAIDSATDAIGLSDPEGHHVYHNKAFTSLFEYTAEELAAAGSEAAFAVKSTAREVFGSIMSGRSWSGEVEMRSKSGRIFGLFLRADAIKDDDGKIVGLVGVFTDISERKRLESQLRKKHDELQLILDSIPAYVFYKDKDGKMLNINKAAMALAYAPKEKLLHKTVFDLMPKTADKYNRDDMEVIRSGQPKINIEESLELPSGKKWLRTDKLPIKDDDGSIVGLLGFSVDITDRKEAQDELAQSEALLRSFFNSPGLICGVVELEGDDIRYITVNAAMAAMYGLAPEDVSNKLASEIGTDRDIAELFIDHYEKSRKNEAPVYFEYHRGVGPETRWFFVTVTFLGLEPNKYRPRFAFVTSDITERKRAEEALRNSEEKLRVMFETMTDAVVLTDLNGTVLDINASAVKTFGYRKEEVMGMNGLEVLAFEDKERAVKGLSESMYGSEIRGVQEFNILDKNGRKVSSEISVNRLCDSNGKPYGFIVVVRDVTTRKVAEEALRESEQKLRLMFESIKDGIFVVDMHGNVMEVNEGTTKITGYTRENLIGQSGLDHIFPGFRANAMGMLSKVLTRDGVGREVEIPVERADGKIIDVEANASVMRDISGNPIGLIGVVRDISERKRMAAALRDSEEKLRLMFASMADGVVVTDTDGKITDVNDAQLRMFGFRDKSELISRGGFDFLAERERGRALADMFKVYEEGLNTGSTYAVVDKNGREFECELSTALLHDPAGKPSGTVTVMRDVTERRRMDQVLRESEKRYRLLADNVSDVIWTMDMNLKYTFISPSVFHMRGFTAEEVMGMSLQDMLTPASAKVFLESLTEEFTIEGRGSADPFRSRTLELELRCKDGSTIWAETKMTFIYDNDGNRIGLLGITRDISERRKTQEALREANEKLQVIFDSIGEAVTVVDISGNIVDANKEALRLHGFDSKGAIIGRKASEMVAPVDRERAVNDAIKALKSSYSLGRIEYKLVEANGREFEGEFNVAVIKDNKGKPAGFIGVARDISERKKVEALQGRLAAIVEYSQDAIIGKTLDGIVTSWNRGAEMLYGYAAEEVVGHSIAILAPPENANEMPELLGRIGRGEAVRNYEAVRITKDGRRITVLLTISPIRVASGEVVAASTIAQNITERKKMEENLKKSEEYFKEITENSSDMIIITLENGDVKYCSRSVERFAGYKPEELIGKNAFRFIHPDDVQRAVSDYGKAVLQRDTAMPNAFRIVHKDGTARFFEGMGRNLLYNPSVEGFVMNIRDVTDRRKMETALRDSEEKLRVMFDSMMDGIVVSDQNIKIVDVNKAVLEMTGETSKEDLIGRSAMEVIKFKDQAAAMANLAEMLQERRPQEKVEYSVVFPSGKEMEIEVSTAMMHDSAGALIGFVNAIRDVSERKKAEEALRKSEEKYRTLAEATTDIVYSIDNMGNLTFIGPQVVRYGLDHEKMVGRNLLDFICLEDREKVLLDFERTAKTGAEFPTEFRVLDADGIAHWIEEMGSLQRDASGTIIGTTGVLRDITERKKAETALRESETRFRHIMENSQDASYRRNLRTNGYDYLSPVIINLTGYTVEEMTAMTESAVVEHIHPDDREQVKRIFADALSGLSRTYLVEYRFMCKDGQYRWMNDLGSIILDERGNQQFLVGALRDITERKKSEAEISVLSNAFGAALDPILILDMEGKVINVNEAARRLFETEELGVSALDYAVAEDKEKIIAAMQGLITGTGINVVEFTIVSKSGRRVPVEATGSLMTDAKGKASGFVVVERDITERKRAEEALKKSEEKYRNLVEREKDVIVSVDSLGFVKSVNSAARMWGYSPEELMNMNFLDLIAPEWREVTAIELQNRLLASGEYTGETMSISKNGDLRPIEYSAVVIAEEGKYAGAQAIVRDISERKKTEEAVQARERYFRAITDLSSGAVLVVNRDGNILDVTGGLESISGHTREGTIGRSAIEFIHPEELEKAGLAFAEALRNPGKTVAFEARLKNARGEWQWTESMITNLLDNPNVHGIVNHLMDITERKKTEEKIRNHAKRIEALYSVAQVISQSSMLEAMLNDSLDRVCSAMDTESGCIFVLDLGENALKLKAWRGVPGDAVQQFSSITLTDGGIENLMNLTGPITTVDETQDVIEPDKMKKVTVDLGRRGIAAVPFFSGKDFQGLIVVFTSKERTFSTEDLDLFKTAANEISIGINNMVLLEKTREMSVTDELTGLYNRRYFFEMLDVEMNRSGRTKHPFSLVMLDLDGFKEYNDKYGHTNGDAALQTFSRMLKSSIRKSDMAFRYGGDEFALILPSADAERAKKIVQRTRAKWQKAPLAQARIFGGHVGFSTGIAEYPENAESSDGLIFLADAALYQAKKKGYEDKLVSELRTLSTDIIDMATQDQVYALAATVDARDPYTYGHSQRVAEIAMAIGKQIGMSAEDLTKLHAAALLHDIGKVGVPDSILTKMGKPTPEEWDVIKKHCAEGARILGYVKELSTLVPIVLHHHEWYDGSGYPGGLKGMDIPSGARITSVADAYDTMVTKRPYRNIISPKEACEELTRFAGVQFDPTIVDVWCQLVDKESKKDKKI